MSELSRERIEREERFLGRHLEGTPQVKAGAGVSAEEAGPRHGGRSISRWWDRQRCQLLLRGQVWCRVHSGHWAPWPGSCRGCNSDQPWEGWGGQQMAVC